MQRKHDQKLIIICGAKSSLADGVAEVRLRLPEDCSMLTPRSRTQMAQITLKLCFHVLARSDEVLALRMENASQTSQSS